MDVSRAKTHIKFISSLGLLLVALVWPASAQLRPPAQLTAEFTATGAKLSSQGGIALIGARGQLKKRSILIVNHETAPLRILALDHPGDRFTSVLQTIEEGRRYRVTLTLRPDGPLGRAQQKLRIKTSSNTAPVLEIPVGVRVTPTVYTSVDQLNLGSRSLADVRSGDEAQVDEFAVFQTGGRDFRITYSTDLPMLKLTSQRDPRGAYYVIFVALVREKLQPGRFRGSIFIATNDPAVPSLTVPVEGTIVSTSAP